MFLVRSNGAGIQQIVIAQWHGTYEYAAKLEYLCIGIYGNRSCAPDLDGRGFGTALTVTVGSYEAARRPKNVPKLLVSSAQRTVGREVGAKKIINLLGTDSIFREYLEEIYLLLRVPIRSNDVWDRDEGTMRLTPIICRFCLIRLIILYDFFPNPDATCFAMHK